MLTPSQSRVLPYPDGEYAIVASEYNKRYVDSMLRFAKAELKASGAKKLSVYRVPGAFEIPVIMEEILARRAENLTAALAFGVVIQGETEHARHIGDTVSHLLGEMAVRYRLPLIFEVLLLNDENQAKARCLDATLNKGKEAAFTALKMAHLMKRLKSE